MYIPDKPELGVRVGVGAQETLCVEMEVLLPLVETPLASSSLLAETKIQQVYGLAI